VHVAFQDELGNVYRTSGSIYVDTVKPTVSLTINGGAVITLDEEVSLSIEASDPGREEEALALSMELSHDGLTWLPAESYAENKAWTVGGGFGAKQVFVRVSDEAGNVSDVANASIAYRSVPSLEASAVQSVENMSYSFKIADFPFQNDDAAELDSYTIVALPQHGKLLLDDVELEAGDAIAAAGLADLLYVPNANWFGEDQLTWSGEADGVVSAANAVLTIEVSEVNVAPVAINVTLNKTSYSAAQGNLDATDGDGDVLTYHIVDAPNDGRVVLDEQTGEYTFTANQNRNGTYTFTYRVYDGSEYSNTATVTITYAVPIPPSIIVPPVQSGIKLKFGDGAENPFTGQVDIRGDSITVKLAQSDLNGLSEKNRNQSIELKLPEGFVNVRIELNQQALATLAANGNHFALLARDVQLHVSNEELKRLLADRHAGLALSASRGGEEATARMQERAALGGYQLLGRLVTVEWLALNEQKEALPLNSFGRMVLPYEAGNGKLLPTALLKAQESGALSPITAIFAHAMDGQNGGASAVGYGSGTYVLINKQPSFADVSGWSKKAIDTLASRLILSGVNASTFEPGRAINRAEFATVISKALGLTGSNDSVGFGDVASNSWYAQAVTAVAELGLINGYEDGTYRPVQVITREEAMVIAARMLRQSEPGLVLTEREVDEILEGYGDQISLGKWARGDVALAIREGLISGSNGQLNAKDQITREQVAAVIVRLLERLELL